MVRRRESRRHFLANVGGLLLELPQEIVVLLADALVHQEHLDHFHALLEIVGRQVFDQHRKIVDVHAAVGLEIFGDVRLGGEQLLSMS